MRISKVAFDQTLASVLRLWSRPGFRLVIYKTQDASTI